MAEVQRTPVSGRVPVHPGSAGSERRVFSSNTNNNCNVKQQLFPNPRYQNLKPSRVATPTEKAEKPQLGKLYLDTKTNMVSNEVL